MPRSRYRIAYGPSARTEINKMTRDQKKALDKKADRIASNPRGEGTWDRKAEVYNGSWQYGILTWAIHEQQVTVSIIRIVTMG